MDEKQCLTGRWRVNIKLHRNQKELMVKLGRSKMEQWAIQFADEDLVLYQFKGVSKNKDIIHKFSKNVHIYLRDQKARKMLQTVYSWVGKDPDVRYNWNWTTTISQEKRKIYKHEDDQKKFGPCESECYLGSKYAPPSAPSFTIIWRLQRDNSILKNYHHINEQGQLVCRLDYMFKSSKGAETVSAIKVYDRVPFTHEDEREMAEHKMSKQIVKI